MKIKLFTHTDLDGVGCAVLAYLAFGRENVDVEYCDYRDVNGKIREFYLFDDEKYDSIYITDISVDEEVAMEIDSLVAAGEKWRLFDHHVTALWLNKYGWCEVRANDTLSNCKTSGTAIFFKYLVDCEYFVEFEPELINNLVRFVKIVRDYDTWRWKELGEEGVVCKQVNDLFYIYGREEFIEWAIHGIRGDFCPSPIINVFPLFSGIDYAVLDQR